jgi:hypothetical protein
VANRRPDTPLPILRRAAVGHSADVLLFQSACVFAPPLRIPPGNPCCLGLLQVLLAETPPRTRCVSRVPSGQSAQTRSAPPFARWSCLRRTATASPCTPSLRFAIATKNPAAPPQPLAAPQISSRRPQHHVVFPTRFCPSPAFGLPSRQPPSLSAHYRHVDSSLPARRGIDWRGAPCHNTNCVLCDNLIPSWPASALRHEVPRRVCTTHAARTIPSS